MIVEAHNTVLLQIHHAMVLSPDQPTDLRHPPISNLPERLQSMVLGLCKLVQRTLPATHGFSTEHASLFVDNLANMIYPGLPFFQETWEKGWDERCLSEGWLREDVAGKRREECESLRGV